MQEFGRWLPLMVITDISEANIVTTDTRMFALYTILRKETLDVEAIKEEMEANNWYERNYRETIEIYQGKTECDEEYIIKEEDVLPFLNKIYNIKNETKELMLRFELENCDFWVKYIRMFRFPNTNEFIVTNDGKPIKWRRISEKNLLKFL